MQPQEEVGVRDVAAVDEVPHVPHLSVKRLARLGEARDEPPQLARRVARLGVRDATDEEQPRALQLGDGAQEPARRAEVAVRYVEVRAGDGEQRGRGRPRRRGDVVVERVQRGGTRVGRQ